MDDYAPSLYPYYNPYSYTRAAAAQAQARPARPSKVLAWVLLGLGALCGAATAAVGVFVKNPAITWPLVTLGLLGIVAGLILAHRSSGASSSRPTTTVTAPAQAPAPVRCTPEPPLYEALAFTAVHCPGTEQLDTSSSGSGSTPICEGRSEGKPTDGMRECGSGHAQEPQQEHKGLPDPEAALPSAGLHPRSGGPGCFTSRGVAPAGAFNGLWCGPAGAAGCGAVVCGWRVAGPGCEGLVDVRPVLVLQPQPAEAALYESEAVAAAEAEGVGAARAGEGAEMGVTSGAGEGAELGYESGDSEEPASGMASEGLGTGTQGGVEAASS
ncbi:hypothetical protein HYH03_010992 [Edaphochlamys debaryana]|uniref:Uncharacterized protein n=1 Tax=Edaphochlamys debaryana TaxID=47281 RepID=A0A836BWY0_9CHLO|nr:hypothetical protein HYH03_010992 [Edaphochlamys debaryana]|eukprot:KAG2490599.1 hypothetical protein HYH03_010992 [Edaphochlamys debaryana]